MSETARDAALLERLRHDDTAAFADLFNEYWTRLCAAAAVYTHDMSEAEEIVATIFADIWERRATLAITTGFRTYLHTAVKHRTMNWRRDRSRHDAITQAAFPSDVPGTGTISMSPTAALEHEETLRELLAAVNQLPERYRLAFTYRWYDGWEYATIATVLGVSLSGAKVLVHRAVAMIRARLGVQ